MKRKGKGRKAKSVSMMGGSNEPFARTAKKPGPDDKPHARPAPASVNKNTAKARVKRLAGVML